MMVTVLIYAYASGVFSSRRIARKLHEDVAFRLLCGGSFPRHRTICFRRRHLDDFRLCERCVGTVVAPDCPQAARGCRPAREPA